MIVQSYYCINCTLACLMTLIWLDNNGHISNLRSLAFVYHYGVQSRRLRRAVDVSVDLCWVEGVCP